MKIMIITTFSLGNAKFLNSGIVLLPDETVGWEMCVGLRCACRQCRPLHFSSLGVRSSSPISPISLNNIAFSLASHLSTSSFRVRSTMGCLVSAPPVTPDGNEVDAMLNAAKEQEEFNPKILLLGAGESGKSTVIKQIKLIWKVGGGLSERDKIDYRNALRRNTIESILVLIEASKTLNIPLGPEASAMAKEISLLQSDADLEENIAKKIYDLWQDPGIQSVFARRSEYWNLDATPYYLNEVHRFATDFDVTEDDVLMARIRTTGIVVTQVPDTPYIYHVVDVGGQRSERRKWIHCFDNVNAIIFLEGLSGYNQVLFEDNTVNRMHESLNLFEDILKNPLFKETPIFIFLNKKDLFEEMIPKYPLSNCFPEYDGPPGEVRPALDFIEKKYNDIAARVCPGKKIFIQVIAARVRMDMKVAFGEVKEQLKKISAAKKEKDKKGKKK